jgi:hypothetical protein
MQPLISSQSSTANPVVVVLIVASPLAAATVRLTSEPTVPVNEICPTVRVTSSASSSHAPDGTLSLPVASTCPVPL